MPEKTPRWLDWLGHIGYISLLAGVYLVGTKIAWGWGFYVAGCAIWIFIGTQLKMTSVWIWQTVATLNGIWAWWRW